MIRSIKHGKRAGNDPWKGNTLEWFTQSPPPREQLRRDPARAQRRADEGHPPRGRGGARAETVPSPRRHAACSLGPREQRPSAGYRRLALATGVATFAADHRRRHRARVRLRARLRPRRLGLPRLAVLQRRRGAGRSTSTRSSSTPTGRWPGSVGIMILALVVLAWRRYRAHRALVWVTAALRGARARPGRCSAARPSRRTSRRRSWPPTSGWRCCCSALLLYVWRAARADVTGAAPRRRRPAASARSPWPPSARALHDRGRRLHGRAPRTTAAPTTSSATAPTTPAARSSPPATATSCRSARRGSWTST